MTRQLLGQQAQQVQKDMKNQASLPLKWKGLQAKLTVGESDDVYEREADRIADQVMSMPKPVAPRASPVQVQRFGGHSAGQAREAPPSVERVLASPGRPLEPAVREEMEQRFGHDFSHVRIHTETAAAVSARDVNAHAYTSGNHVVFGAGTYVPNSQTGQRLLSHELSHVVQQSNFISAKSIQRQQTNTRATTRWSLNIDVAEIDTFIAGTLARGQLKNRDTGQIVSGHWVTAGGGGGISYRSPDKWRELLDKWRRFIPSLSSGSWTDFETTSPNTFAAFDGAIVRYISVSAGIRFLESGIGYGVAYFSFTDLMDEGVRMAGVAVNQTNISGSVTSGVWNFTQPIPH